MLQGPYQNNTQQSSSYSVPQQPLVYQQPQQPLVYQLPQSAQQTYYEQPQTSQNPVYTSQQYQPQTQLYQPDPFAHIAQQPPTQQSYVQVGPDGQQIQHPGYFGPAPPSANASQQQYYQAPASQQQLYQAPPQYGPGPMQQQQQQQQQQFAQPQQQPSGPALDPALQQRVMDYIHQATPAQFKPNKLYVLFNDPNCRACLQIVGSNVEVEQLVELIDASNPVSRPQWLRGVPSLLDDKGQLFQGGEAVQWLRWQNAQTLPAFNESSGASTIAPGMPAAMDGTASFSGSLGMTEFLPQQMVSDQDMLRRINQQSAQTYTFEQAQAAYNAYQPQIAPPQGWHNGAQPPQPQWTQQVQRGGNVEELNNRIARFGEEREALLSQTRRMPHMMQRRMGWNPIQTTKVGTDRDRQAELLNQRMALLAQQRQQISVPVGRAGWQQ